MSKKYKHHEKNNYVHIINTETKEVVKRMGPYTEYKAEKVLSGASINLNHAMFHVEIVGPEGK